jgi:hypothetical protein
MQDEGETKWKIVKDVDMRGGIKHLDRLAPNTSRSRLGGKGGQKDYHVH